MKNTIELTLEQAVELYNGLSSLTTGRYIDIKNALEDKFPELRPKMITDLVTDINSVFHFEMANNIYQNSITIYSTSDENDRAILAFAQLSSLAFVLNEGWEPDWNDASQGKWSAYYHGQKMKLNTNQDWITSSGGIYFKSETLLLHALKHNEQLFKDLFKVR